MATFQGISQVAFYDKNADTDDSDYDFASVIFDRLDATKSKIDFNAPAKGERDVTGGMVYSGEMFRLMIEGADDEASTRLRDLREWLVANKRVSAIALSADGTVAYNWLEADRLMEARPVPVMGELKGRADFVRTGLERIAHNPQIYVQRNIVSHLDPWDLSDASTDLTRTFFLPIPGVNLYVSCKVEEVDGQNFNAAAKVLKLEFLDVAGDPIGSADMATYVEGRVELTGITPADVHEVRVTAAVPNATFTVSELAVRLDESYNYIAR